MFREEADTPRALFPGCDAAPGRSNRSAAKAASGTLADGNGEIDQASPAQARLLGIEDWERRRSTLSPTSVTTTTGPFTTELVFESMPMSLTRPGARAHLQQIDAILVAASGRPERPPSLVLAGLVERLGIARSSARTGLRNVDLHVSISRDAVHSVYGRSCCFAASSSTARSGRARSSQADPYLLFVDIGSGNPESAPLRGNLSDRCDGNPQTRFSCII